jgi:hypothetical protein
VHLPDRFPDNTEASLVLAVLKGVLVDKPTNPTLGVAARNLLIYRVVLTARPHSTTTGP